MPSATAIATVEIEVLTCLPMCIYESKVSVPMVLKCMFCVSELRSCVKVEVAVLGSPSLIVLMVSVDIN